MHHKRDIHGLRKYAFGAQALAALVFLFGVVSLVLFHDPSWLGMAQTPPDPYRGRVVWLLTGIGFLGFAVFCFVLAGRWSRQLLWILNNVKPETMKLSVAIDSTSEGTHYYGFLSAGGEERAADPIWKVALYSPSWDVRELAQREVVAQVYRDPESQKPAVIETELGLLWAMAGSGSVQRLS